MLAFDSYRKLRKGKRYNTITDYNISEIGIIEGNGVRNPSENLDEEFPEVRVLTQKVVNEQLNDFMTPITRQLKKLTWLVQEMMTTPQPSHYPRADYSAISGESVHQPDNRVKLETTLRSLDETTNRQHNHHNRDLINWQEMYCKHNVPTESTTSQQISQIVSTYTLGFDGKNEKGELFENLLPTMEATCTLSKQNPNPLEHNRTARS